MACFGGPPAFEEPVHVGRPNLGDRERFLRRVNQILDRRWFSNDGPVVRELEHSLARYLGVEHVVALANGTLALEVAIRALGLRDEVLIPSFTFIGTAHALAWQQITPVFCDIDPQTHNLDASLIEQRITPHTSGILGVHVWGEPCAVEALTEIARRRGVALLFDACHAFGCAHSGRMIGGFGSAEVFSFHATKYFNTFEGGAVATNQGELACRMRLIRNFGFTGYDRVVQIGINGKMSEISAAMGLTGLESLGDFVAVNRAHYQRYRRMLDGVAGLRMYPVCETEQRNYQYVVAQVDRKAARISRDVLLEVLHRENVLARRYFYPGCHRMEPYCSAARSRVPLPETERLCDQVLVLPTGTAVDDQAVDCICDLIRLTIENAAEIAERLA